MTERQKRERLAHELTLVLGLLVEFHRTEYGQAMTVDEDQVYVAVMARISELRRKLES